MNNWTSVGQQEFNRSVAYYTLNTTVVFFRGWSCILFIASWLIRPSSV